MSDTKEKKFDDRLSCFVDSLSYDFNSLTGKLHITDGGCCDMTGCIKLFKLIDPKVTKILTYSGAKEDTSYVKKDTKWVVFCHLDGSVVNECEDADF